MLDGIPVALKDVLCTAGEPTTCSSRMLANFVPPYDATVVRKLRAAGLVLLGKTNMDEFAMGGSTENAALGTTRNPWDLSRVPGGSSGGSAAAVAARMAPLARSAPTRAGRFASRRRSAATVGLKPTYGRVSRFGLVAFASSLDQVGPMARTAEDAALLLEVIAGPDPQDATCADVPVEPYSRSVAEPLGTLTLGVVREQFGAGLELRGRCGGASAPSTRFARWVPHPRRLAPAQSLRDRDLLHHRPVRSVEQPGPLRRRALRLPHRRGVDAAANWRTSGAWRGSADDVDSALLRMYRRTRAEGFGPEVKRRIMLGTYALSAGYYDAYYLKALKVRRLIRNDFDAAFQQVDLLIGPTTPSPAFRTGEKLRRSAGDVLGGSVHRHGESGGHRRAVGPVRLHPVAGLPIGVQLLAPAFQESRLLRAAHHYQQQTDWHTRMPELS